MAAQIVFVGHMLGIPPEFGAGREQPRPVRVRFERIRVGHRRDVDGQARIVIDVPGTAEVVLTFEDREIVEAESLERDGGPMPPKPAPTMIASWSGPESSTAREPRSCMNLTVSGDDRRAVGG